MRHDPAAAAVTIMLRSLKMHGMAQAAAELTEQGAPAFQSAIPILSQLLKAELAEREVRSIAYQLKAARFPTYKDLTRRKERANCRPSAPYRLADPRRIGIPAVQRLGGCPAVSPSQQAVRADKRDHHHQPQFQ